ncbi:uncharacterized protein BO96DRAFT_430629 [Aspergillus niger CBS 101883]|uniref:uncharacterized protein n=1 Tax=Aspergillus lacticoffeatus (strain CBS 101883) TaxID=1450533 RepID=UPI000D7F2C5B|nr:uncharacterized protein BO96DRAFT_430629 [Aspergillus niger CBS 101883]PYH60713.1 hypothetical protein BO96DRAFT_430629 [Aspergillus niger CBS 101883]
MVTGELESKGQSRVLQPSPQTFSPGQPPLELSRFSLPCLCYSPKQKKKKKQTVYELCKEVPSPSQFRFLHTYPVLFISAQNPGIAHLAYHVSKGILVLSRGVHNYPGIYLFLYLAVTQQEEKEKKENSQGEETAEWFPRLPVVIQSSTDDAGGGSGDDVIDDVVFSIRDNSEGDLKGSQLA